MRKRFFSIIFVFLVASIFVISTLEFLFFENERMRLIDQRLEAIASSLIASGLSMHLIENLESTDDLIHDLLGEERVDQIINIYDLNGELLAQNFTGSELPLEFNFKDRWYTITVKDRHVRVFTFTSGRIVIQVGTVIDPTYMSGVNLLSSRSAFFLIFILSLLILTAYYSSELLFSPLKELTTNLHSMSSQLDRKLGQPLSEFVIGPQLNKISSQDKNSPRDEFQLLCLEIITFLKKLENYTRTFNAQTAILTHELKTPLTILRNYMSDLKFSSVQEDQRQELTHHAIEEIDRLTRLINDYLQWSVLSSNPGQLTEIHAIKIREFTKKLVIDMNRLHQDRIVFNGQDEFTVFSLPSHLQQLISNLLINALTYSDEAVICNIVENKLLVIDKGKGIPQEVHENLGTPFNRGREKKNESHGSGLGLAWIHSLCEKYEWKLDIDSSSAGTTISIHFPRS